jgi:cytochrome c biogenesis protein CcmG/thiol:disulfide interchange protein DsbE
VPRNRSRVKGAFRAVAAAVVLTALLPLLAARLVNHPAPPFARSDLNGSRITLSAYRGKVILLNFWATWCAPCRVEMPRFVGWQTRYGPRGLQIVAVSMDDDVDPVRTFLRGVQPNYPVLMGDAKLGELYGGVLGLPVTFLIDRTGIIRARFEGETDLRAIETRLCALLQSQ